ncbi:uncharacterized protein LOC134207411 [Armigeres subalbatus]|uniref:uncharacterized protein LOC134207411 n=1 Tax=Armigeres subalbatus TaxID=124917 RepID=UPI002ED51D92
MQRELIMFVALILGNLHGNNGIPAVDHNTNNDESDGDLMMEPDEHNADSATQATVRRSTSIGALLHPYNHHLYITATRREESGLLTDEERAAAASEGFYPSFMRSSRQYFQPTEVDRFRPTTVGRAKLVEQSILGSGDFGVLKGGTFYQDNDPPLRGYQNDYYGLNLKSHNGHQRPFAAPLVQKFRYPSDAADPFSNFRDFADINVSTDGGQYSELYVVYANKNSSHTEKGAKKKIDVTNKKTIQNIKDKLDLIDKEISSEHKLTKLSKTKLKLLKSKKQTKIKNEAEATSTTSIPEPESDFMLALS